MARRRLSERYPFFNSIWWFIIVVAGIAVVAAGLAFLGDHIWPNNLGE